MRYLEGETISDEEIMDCLIKGIRQAIIFPVLCGSAYKDIGLQGKKDEAEAVKKQVTEQADRLKELEMREAELQEEVRQRIDVYKRQGNSRAGIRSGWNFFPRRVIFYVPARKNRPPG